MKPNPSATNNKMTGAQKKFFTGAAIIVCAIGYLIYSAIDTSANYYYTVAEVKSMGDRALGIALRLEGNVAVGTIKADSTNLKWNFDIVDESEQSIPVYYEGSGARYAEGRNRRGCGRQAERQGRACGHQGFDQLSFPV